LLQVGVSPSDHDSKPQAHSIPLVLPVCHNTLLTVSPILCGGYMRQVCD